MTGVDQATVDQMRAYVGAIIPAVEDKDADRIAAVYRELQSRFGVDGPHAVAMILAEQIRVERGKWRDRLIAAQSETLRFQDAYLDEKRRVGELRSILDQRAATSPAKQQRKESHGTQ
ncbi:MAG: hypothetical protein ACK5LO_02445 [Leucobacter sp.]